MANIATCPQCAKQLGLPPAVGRADRVECPECQTVFSLAETVQISLPVARLLDPTEQHPAPGGGLATAAIGETEPAVVASVSACAPTSDPPNEGLARVRSWEARLKQALAKGEAEEQEASNADGSGGQAEAGPASAAGQTTETAPTVAPSFEFELDPTTAADLEQERSKRNRDLPASDLSDPATALPAAQRTKARAKTLADFAAAEELPAVVLNPSTSAAFEAPKIADKIEIASAMTVAQRLPQVDGRPEPFPAASTATEAPIGPSVRRQSVAGPGFPRVAAFAVGPIAGSLLGLYGLLWLQGAGADYVGLARVLPASILPVDLPVGMSAADAESALSESTAPETSSSTTADAPLLTAQRQPDAIRRDESVRPASAARPVSAAAQAVVPTVRITADEFNRLVDAAAAALPNFVNGGLSSEGSIKRKGQAYIALCQLAEHFAFAQQPGLAPAVQAKARQAAELYLQATRQANSRQDLSHISARWWEYGQRPSAGIFLAGHVGEMAAVEAGTLCWVKLDNSSTVPEIPVLFKQPGFQAGDQIGVVGSVISSPADLPAGFSGRQIVKADYGFQLLMAP